MQVERAASAYTAAGVDIDAGNSAVNLMRASVLTTYDRRVLAGIGAFGGLFDASELKDMRAPVLVASTDGVGTKVKLAAQARRFESIGHDIVNHCINDILVQAARPLFFMDYLAGSNLDAPMLAELVAGMASACRAAGCALLGGETAEMPGVYVPGEFDVAGTIVGLVERDNVLPRRDLGAGDVLVGFSSSGPHTNGYSLIRAIFAGERLDIVRPELGTTLCDALLAPHRSYLPVVGPVLAKQPLLVKALVHLTGGAFLENIPRVLPDGVRAVVRTANWPKPPLFALIQQQGGISTEEMYRVFNMGIGMAAIVSAENVPELRSVLDEECWIIGELIEGARGVELA